MKTRIVEATDGVLYGKFLLGRFDTEWARRAAVCDTMPEGTARMPLLRQEGWGPDHLLVMDISRPGYGSIFRPGGYAQADLAKKGLDGLV